MEFERIRRRHTHIDIAPLVDMVFLLLLFFLLTYQAAADYGIEVNLPGAETARPQESAGVELQIDAEGDLYIGGTRISLDELPGVLEKHASEERILIVRADRKAQVGLLVGIMDAGRKSGFVDINIVTEKKKE
jgi:biopolymer transport protein ExbD